MLCLTFAALGYLVIRYMPYFILLLLGLLKVLFATPLGWALLIFIITGLVSIGLPENRLYNYKAKSIDSLHSAISSIAGFGYGTEKPYTGIQKIKEIKPILSKTWEAKQRKQNHAVFTQSVRH